MNFDHVVGTIVSKGFTEQQARFLVLVARHSGVCVMRQYSAFAGVVFGHTTRKFFTKLERLGWVSTYDCARKRARIYHVRHRELYEAIGDAESRLRRPPTVPRALERIMLLDVILNEPDLVWLATSEEKMTHVPAFTAITKDSLPQMTTPQGSYEPVRYFPDQVPIGIHPDGRWIVVCLLTQDARRELRTFLERHLMFLAALPTWTLRVVIPAHMAAYPPQTRAIELAGVSDSLVRQCFNGSQSSTVEQLRCEITHARGETPGLRHEDSQRTRHRLTLPENVRQGRHLDAVRVTRLLRLRQLSGIPEQDQAVRGRRNGQRTRQRELSRLVYEQQIDCSRRGVVRPQPRRSPKHLHFARSNSGQSRFVGLEWPHIWRHILVVLWFASEDDDFVGRCRLLANAIKEVLNDFVAGRGDTDAPGRHRHRTSCP
jgi:hypothetical protein